METEIPILDMLTRLSVAAGLALFLGLERELHGKPAGLRSHMLVSLGSATFIIIGMSILFATAEGDPSARIDPSRVVEGVIGGIGFLGAGSIIRSGGHIQGITTGASIWLAGAIGVSAGINNFPLAVMVTVIALIIMVGLGQFEREVINEKKNKKQS
ncbi:magnesium transporter MgtC [Aliidiomarina sedimenti]|uniref:Protein MgtC n=1 Tax=Aliidiomarina sedimenti TaxID=1933879 RepID=A0ABY0C1W9_9GAMM|nr:MgtC/SapB family protein [Aliidiomarina sedimenti]RUO31562.1 magnesium transporter MgtC [Aliidiomarina sedimenti]